MRPPRELKFAIDWWNHALPPGSSGPSAELLERERAAEIKERTGRNARKRLGIERSPRQSFGGSVIYSRPPALEPKQPEKQTAGELSSPIPGCSEPFVTLQKPGESTQQHAERHREMVLFLARRPRAKTATARAANGGAILQCASRRVAS